MNYQGNYNSSHIVGIAALILERKLKRSTLISVYSLIKSTLDVTGTPPIGHRRNIFSNQIRNLLEDKGGVLVGINQKKSSGRGIACYLYEFKRRSRNVSSV